MSRSRIHDRNRRITAITGTRGKGQQHPEAAITRGFQEWYRNCPHSELDSIHSSTYYGHYKTLLSRHGSHDAVMKLLVKEFATATDVEHTERLTRERDARRADNIAHIEQPSWASRRTEG